MRTPRGLVVCCALCCTGSCARIFGIHGAEVGDGGATSDAPGTTRPPNCSLGLSVDGVCPTVTAGVGETCAATPARVSCWGQGVPQISSDAYQPMGVPAARPGATIVLSSTNDGQQTGPSDFSTGCWISNELVSCFGNSEVGQGGMYLPNGLLQPTAVAGIGNVTAIAVGGDHVCASDGSTLHCWGQSNLDQLDNELAGTACGSPPCDLMPTTQSPISVTGAFVAGRSHTCLADDSQGISCWGDNSRGELGENHEGSGADITSVFLSGGGKLTGKIASLAAGFDYTCAIVQSSADAGTWCWGANDVNQLGFDAPLDQISPAQITTAPAFVAIAAGTQTTCAIDSIGDVWCWGSNRSGMAGKGPPPGSMIVPQSLHVPTQIAVAHARAISVGDTHACAVLDSGDIECWGDNTHGELGDGVTIHSGAEACGHDCSWDPVTVMP